MRAIIVERQRIGDAAAREGEAGLFCQERDFLGIAEEERMRAVRGEAEASFEQRRDVLCLDRPVGDTAGGVSTSTIGSSQ